MAWSILYFGGRQDKHITKHSQTHMFEKTQSVNPPASSLALNTNYQQSSIQIQQH